MTDEFTVSGYCRNADISRIVICEIEDGKAEFDCRYPDCRFADTCVIIKSAKEKLNDEQK